MISLVNLTKSAETMDFVIFTEEILNGKHRFLCSDLNLMTLLEYYLGSTVTLRMSCLIFNF